MKKGQKVREELLHLPWKHVSMNGVSVALFADIPQTENKHTTRHTFPQGFFIQNKSSGFHSFV